MSEDKSGVGPASDRRSFLKLAGLGTVGTVAAAAGAVAAEAPASVDDGNPSGSKYRETEHVKRVYELARF